MRPSRPCVPVPCPHLTWLLGLVLLVGLTACGSPSPEAPVSGPPSGSAVAPGQVPTLTSPPGPPASAAERRSPDAPRATSPASAVSPATTTPSNAPTIAEQAQREARQIWFAEMRESPDPMVRLQALETWAQQPGQSSDSLIYALVDEDEAVRARAETLYEQELAREEATTVP